MSTPTPRTVAGRNNPWPIIHKCIRERCRPTVLLSWGLVVIAVTTAICMGVYFTETERAGATAVEAARAMVIPVIIIQAVILMFLGTGAVAFGISGERDSGVLDYQRMTPLTTRAKLLGYLFGLPIREYALFALTLPYIAFAVIRGNLGWAVFAHFYLIFAISVIVYHLTGFVAGMISPKARRAAVFAQVFVVVLYFGLPNLSRIGLTFFEFLTIRPALFGLIQNEIETLNGAPLLTIPPELSAIDTFRDIPVFGTTLHPTIYTLIVQGLLIATLWHLISRRWRADDIPGFSKLGAALFLFATSTLVLASGWASLSGDHGILGLLNGHNASHASVARTSLILAMLYTLMILCFGVFTLANASASPFLTSKGFHRMRRHGWRRLGVLRDESTSLPLALLAIATTTTGACAMYGLLVRRAVIPGWPSLATGALVLVSLACVILFAQAVCERFNTRGRFVAFFLVWVIPFLVFGVLMGADARPAIALYAALPCPPTTAFLTLDQALASLSLPDGMQPITLLRNEDGLAKNFPALPITGALVHLALAIGAQSVNLRDRARRKATALGHSNAALAHTPSLVDAHRVAAAS